MLNYKISNDIVLISTDNDILEIDKKDLAATIKTFLLANEMKDELPVLCRAKEQLPNLANIIFENIANITADAEFIPKATAIDKSVNTLINLMKTEIVYMKMLAKD